MTSSELPTNGDRISTDDVIRAVSKKLRYYVQYKRREDGFRLPLQKGSNRLPTITQNVPTRLHERSINYLLDGGQAQTILDCLKQNTRLSKREREVRASIYSYLFHAPSIGVRRTRAQQRDNGVLQAISTQSSIDNKPNTVERLRSVPAAETRRLVTMATRLLVAAESGCPKEEDRKVLLQQLHHLISEEKEFPPSQLKVKEKPGPKKLSRSSSTIQRMPSCSFSECLLTQTNSAPLTPRHSPLRRAKKRRMRRRMLRSRPSLKDGTAQTDPEILQVTEDFQRRKRGSDIEDNSLVANTSRVVSPLSSSTKTCETDNATSVASRNITPMSGVIIAPHPCDDQTVMNCSGSDATVNNPESATVVLKSSGKSSGYGSVSSSNASASFHTSFDEGVEMDPGTLELVSSEMKKILVNPDSDAKDGESEGETLTQSKKQALPLIKVLQDSESIHDFFDDGDDDQTANDEYERKSANDSIDNRDKNESLSHSVDDRHKNESVNNSAGDKDKNESAKYSIDDRDKNESANDSVDARDKNERIKHSIEKDENKSLNDSVEDRDKNELMNDADEIPHSSKNKDKVGEDSEPEMTDNQILTGNCSSSLEVSSLMKDSKNNSMNQSTDNDVLSITEGSSHENENQRLDESSLPSSSSPNVESSTELAESKLSEYSSSKTSTFESESNFSSHSMQTSNDDSKRLEKEVTSISTTTPNSSSTDAQTETSNQSKESEEIGHNLAATDNIIDDEKLQTSGDINHHVNDSSSSDDQWSGSSRSGSCDDNDSDDESTSTITSSMERSDSSLKETDGVSTDEEDSSSGSYVTTDDEDDESDEMCGVCPECKSESLEARLKQKSPRDRSPSEILNRGSNDETKSLPTAGRRRRTAEIENSSSVLKTEPTVTSELETEEGISGTCEDTSASTSKDDTEPLSSTSLDPPHPVGITRSQCVPSDEGTWNVRTLHRDYSLDVLTQEFQRYNLDILGLQETKWTGRQDGEHLQGVSLLLSRHASDVLLGYDCINERFLTAKFRTKIKDLNVICCYAPTEDSDENEKDTFYSQLQDILNSVKKGDISLVLGDFNAKVGTDSDLWAGVLGPFGIGTSNGNGERLLQPLRIMETSPSANQCSLLSPKIHEAARTGDIEKMQELLNEDDKRMETVDERGWTPLHLAACHGQLDVIKFLADKGAHLEALDPSGYNAIHIAAMEGHDSIIQFLLGRGIEVDSVTSEGFTPLHIAVLNHLECCKLLLSSGSSMEAEDQLGRNVMIMSEEHSAPPVRKMIGNMQQNLASFHKLVKVLADAGRPNKPPSESLPKNVLEMLSALAAEEDSTG